MPLIKSTYDILMGATVKLYSVEVMNPHLKNQSNIALMKAFVIIKAERADYFNILFIFIYYRVYIIFYRAVFIIYFTVENNKTCNY